MLSKTVSVFRGCKNEKNVIYSIANKNSCGGLRTFVGMNPMSCMRMNSSPCTTTAANSCSTSVLCWAHWTGHRSGKPANTASNRYPALSLNDCFALVMAETTADAILLRATSDYAAWRNSIEWKHTAFYGFWIKPTNRERLTPLPFMRRCWCWPTIR